VTREKRGKLKVVEKARHMKDGVLQRRRLRTALVLTAAFVCLFALLSVQQSLELNAAAPGTLDYLAAVDEPMPSDPLNIASQSLELVGVSDDGMIVGYATDCAVPQAMAEIDKAMRAKGWSVLGMSAEGISSYVWQGDTTRASSVPPKQGGAPVSQMSQTPQVSQTTGTYVMFVCSERDGGSSVVAEFL
jgi:hypothetical protein